MDIVALLQKYGRAALFTLLMFIAFSSDSYLLPVAVKYAVNLVVFGWACADFFIRPQFNKAMFCMRFFALFFFPYLLFWMWSVGIWIGESQTFAYILRGSLNTFYMLTNLLLVAGALYLMDKAVMFYSMVAMAGTNLLIFFIVGRNFGFAPLLQQYIRLLVTFADETGGVIKQMEVHGLVFGWGVFITYYLMRKEENTRRDWIGLVLSCFFFSLALKRIAIPAVIGAAILYHIMKKVKPSHLRMMANLMAIAVGGGAFLYLFLIKNGVFFEIADRLGINLMYRDVLYSYFRDYYELSPGFFGHGIRFIYTLGNYDPNYTLGTDAVHNVYLEFYLEVGFWCWWIWIFYELAFRVHRVQERYSVAPAVVLFGMNLYVFFTYLTDNTSFYYCINILYRMAVMVFCYESMERENIVDSELRTTDELESIRAQERFLAEKEELP